MLKVKEPLVKKQTFSYLTQESHKFPHVFLSSWFCSLGLRIPCINLAKVLNFAIL